MNQSDCPDDDKRKNDRRTESERSLKIFAKSHGGKRDRSGKPDRGGNEAGHETEGGMVNQRRESDIRRRSGAEPH